MALQTRLGCTVHDMAFLLGIVPAQYYKLVNRSNARKPLPLVIALNVRFLMMNPEFSPLPKSPDPREFFAFCRTIDPDFHLGKFAVLTTRSQAATYRWFRAGDAPVILRPTLARWMLTAWQALHAAPKSERRRMLHELCDVVADEAVARGFNRGALLYAHKLVADGKAPPQEADEAMVYVPPKAPRKRAAGKRAGKATTEKSRTTSTPPVPEAKSERP